MPVMPGEQRSKGDSLFKRLFKKFMKDKKLKPKLKLNPEHPTGKAILDKRKAMKEVLDNS